METNEVKDSIPPTKEELAGWRELLESKIYDHSDVSERLNLLPYLVGGAGLVLLSLVFDPIPIAAGFALGMLTSGLGLQVASHGKGGR